MKSFEQYVKENLEQGSEFRLVIKDKDTFTFYIHPVDRDGTTFDGQIIKNKIVSEEVFNVIWKGICKELWKDEPKFIDPDLLNW